MSRRWSLLAVPLSLIACSGEGESNDTGFDAGASGDAGGTAVGGASGSAGDGGTPDAGGGTGGSSGGSGGSGGSSGSSGSSGSGTVLISVNFDSPPSSESHGGIYAGQVGDISLRLQNGTPADRFDHVTGADCWGQAGGCAKFFPATSGGGNYRGFVPGSYSGGETQLNLRYLMKWNAGYRQTAGYKGDYLTLGTSPFWTQPKGVAAAFGSFQLTQSYDGTLYYIHGNGQSDTACDAEGYECCMHEASCTLGPASAAAGPFELEDYDAQWVAIELELSSAGIFRIYLWTQDGAYDGLYMSATNAPTGTPGITGFSGAFFTDANAGAGAYLMVDEVVLSDQAIGPPPGF